MVAELEDMKMRPRRATLRVNLHPYLFMLMALAAVIELGLTAFLISAGSDVYTWASPGYYALYVCHEGISLSWNI